MNQASAHSRVLITGGAGFVGSHLAARLVAEGHQVRVADVLPNAAGTMLAVSGVIRDVEYVQNDVTDAGSTGEIFEGGIDTVFHLAAQPISALSNQFPAETMRINVDGTRNVCAAAERAGVGVFVLASSACRYGIPDAGAAPLNEQHPARPGFYCYSESKQGAEDAVEGYRVAPMIARFVNIYGPGDRHFTRIVPKLLRCFVRNEAVALTRGNGDTILDYLYIDDAVDGLIALASRGANRRNSTNAEAFNFGVSGNNPVSVKQLALMASVAFDGRGRELNIPSSPVEPVMVKFLDPAKARQVLGWSATVRLQDGLTRTAAWYRDYLDTLAPLEDVVPVSFPLPAFA